MDRTQSSRYIRLFLYLTAIVLINMAGMRLFFRIDLTENHAYSLSEASRTAVSTLSEPLTIHVFFTKNLPAPHNQTEQYLHDLLEEYAIHGNAFFNYRFYNVNPETEGLDRESGKNQILASDYGIQPVQIQIIEKDEVKFKRAYMGLVLIHGDLIERVPMVMSTDGLEYQLTTAIQKLNNKISAFLNLSGNIDITLFLSSSLHAVAPLMGLDDLPSLPREIEGIVNTLNDSMYGKLSFHHIDPTTETDFDKEVAGYSLLSLKWPALSGGKVPAGTGVIGIVMAYDDRVIEIPVLRVLRMPLIGTRYDLVDMNQLEETLNRSLERLIDINEDLGYLAGHGTPDISDGAFNAESTTNQLAAFSQLVSQNYSIKPFSVHNETIPEGLKSLVIAGPKESFTDEQLYQIDQALMRGTNLAVFLDAVEEIEPQHQQTMRFQPPPQVVPVDTGIEKLLNHYGVRMKKSIIMDENCFRQRIPSQFGGGERAIYYAPLIQPEFINHSLDFMKNIKGLIGLKVSPLVLDEKRLAENGITAVRLFSTSDRSWEVSENITFNPMLMHPPDSRDDQKSFDVAYLLEGAFSSYFAGKPIPVRISEHPEESQDNPIAFEKEADQHRDLEGSDLSKIEGDAAFREKGRSGKLIVISSSEFLRDTILDPEGKGPNATFILNVMDVLNDRNDIAVMRSKELRFNPLYTTGALAKTIVKTVNIAGLPAVVILFGCVIYMRRRAKRKRIQMIFLK